MKKKGNQELPSRGMDRVGQAGHQHERTVKAQGAHRVFQSAFTLQMLPSVSATDWLGKG